MSTHTTAVGVPQWDLSDRLRKALKAAGVSVSAMAEHLEVDRKTVGNYLNGRTHPSTSTLRVWALRCGVEFVWLKYGLAAPSPDDGGSTQPVDEDACTRSAQVIDIVRCISGRDQVPALTLAS